ncbi:MAG: amidophosphoribosyltransferase [Candidatus Omnitrophica bacterium]|nr:amidophosphoribosyltransferase [Candidatus Omnitrophota bacterium]
MSGELKENCGLFGVFGHKEAGYLTYLGLYALQHRGEESCGIVSSNGKEIFQYKGMGLVADVFTEEIIKSLTGDRAIGHTRYSTTGASLLKNVQPILVNYSQGVIAIAHNGNLVNALSLHHSLEKGGSIFQTSSDSEILIHLMSREKKGNHLERLLKSVKFLEGAYCFLLLTHEALFAVRDSHGFRPLWLGKLKDAYIFASETCAFDLVGAKEIREIEPGEIVVVDKNGLRSFKPFKKISPSFCIFEHIYFARPDSKIFGETVHIVRKRLGRNLAQEHPVSADLVIPVPDSGTSSALGFSQESGIPMEYGIIRNHYIGRSFIQPRQSIRDFNVRVKFNLLRDVLKGKRIVIVDDSIVRGTTSKIRVRNLREAGAKEVHLRISCPPHCFPCFYGIDFPTKKELIGARLKIEEIEKFLQVDSLGYLSLKGMLSCVEAYPKGSYCVACFTGDYPVKFGKRINKYILEKGCGVHE